MGVQAFGFSHAALNPKPSLFGFTSGLGLISCKAGHLRTLVAVRQILEARSLEPEVGTGTNSFLVVPTIVGESIGFRVQGLGDNDSIVYPNSLFTYRTYVLSVVSLRHPNL